MPWNTCGELYTKKWIQIPEDSAIQPQTNPIERSFSQIKSCVARRTHADGAELKTQIERGIESVTEEHTTNYLRAHLSVLEQVRRGFTGF